MKLDPLIDEDFIALKKEYKAIEEHIQAIEYSIEELEKTLVDLKSKSKNVDNDIYIFMQKHDLLPK